MNKLLGVDDYSIGLRGNGQVHGKTNLFELNPASKAKIKQNGTVLGVGFIFRTQQIFFTMSGREVAQVPIPKGL